MKILWIARTCPFPANDGEKIRVFNLLKNLSHHDITLVFRAMHEKELQGLPTLRKYCREVRYAYIPKPPSNLTRLRWCLPFLFSPYPISLATVYFQEIAQILQELCAEKSYDVVQIEHSSLTIYLDHLKPINRPRTFLTLHNIDSERNERIIENTPFSFYKLFLYYNQWKFKQWEPKSIGKCDEVITVSSEDKNTIKKIRFFSNIHVVPNGVDTETHYMIDGNEEESITIIFVASMDSESNNDGAVFFIKEIFPAIKKTIPATFYAVGRNPTELLKTFHNNKDIFITGEVPDVTEYYSKAEVAIVPLRSGGGTRLKILEAMALGVPVVSTSIGCEGLELENGDHLLVTDDPDGFANAVVEVIKNKELRKALIRASRERMEKQYDWRKIAALQDQLYINLARNNSTSVKTTGPAADCSAGSTQDHHERKC